LRGERAPNVAGATLLGYTEGYEDALRAVDGAAVVLVVDLPLDGVTADRLRAAGQVIYLGTVLPDAARAAQVALPMASVAEEEGTFVNRDHRVQRYFQAKAAPGMARPAWWVLGALLAEMELGGPFGSAAEAFAWLAAEEPRFGGLSYDLLGARGVGKNPSCHHNVIRIHQKAGQHAGGTRPSPEARGMRAPRNTGKPRYRRGAPETPQHDLGHEQRHAKQQQKKEIGEQEGTAAVQRQVMRKLPDVLEADDETGRRQDEHPWRRPVSVNRFSHPFAAHRSHGPRAGFLPVIDYLIV